MKVAGEEARRGQEQPGEQEAVGGKQYLDGEGNMDGEWARKERLGEQVRRRFGLGEGEGWR